MNSVKHTLVASYHAASHGAAECAVRWAEKLCIDKIRTNFDTKA